MENKENKDIVRKEIISEEIEIGTNCSTSSIEKELENIEFYNRNCRFLIPNERLVREPDKNESWSKMKTKYSMENKESNNAAGKEIEWDEIEPIRRTVQ